MSFTTGAKSKKIIDELKKYVVFEPYTFALDLAQCKGMNLKTVDGDILIDWTGFYASRLIGMNHPKLMETEYLRRLSVVANNKIANPDFPTPECLEYYRLIYSLAPECMRNPNLEVYAVNSGAEAVENMMKYMISLHQEAMIKKGKIPNARRFVYFDQAFHGRTVFALNVTQLSNNPNLTKGFHGFAPGNIQIPFPAINTDASKAENDAITKRALDRLEDILSSYADEIAGIVVEPIQGAGGHRMAQKEFFQGVSKLAHRFGVNFGFDEVQTSGGQTGKIFAVDLFDLPHAPVAVAVAKKFGNGVVFMHHTMEDRGVLDSTWGGSLVDMVRFVQEWQVVVNEELIQKVPLKASHLVDGLKRLQQKHRGLISNIRGMGLYQGFSLDDAATRDKVVELALHQENLLLLEAGVDSIRFRPNLHVTIEDIDIMIEKLDRVLLQVS
jgi:L-lysine 6-transaminase